MVVRGGTIINISGLTPVDDPEYRYKMPAVFGKIEGSGNGIKTAIPNISDVATSLHRAPGEVNKFFGTELGAQSRYAPDTDRAIVNGAHTDAVLQELVHKYVEKFVLCPNCGLPETEYKIKSETIFHKCMACGAKEMVDMNHRLCNYILAEDKKAKKEKGKNKKEDKKSKKDKKKDKDGSDDDKKKKKDKKKEKKDKKKEKNGDGKDDYIKDALFGKKDEDTFDADEESEENETDEAGVDDAGALLLAVEATQKFLESNPSAPAKELVEIVTNQQMASALKSQFKLHILVRACISPDSFKIDDIKKYIPAMSLITNGSKIMERHLIASMEALYVKKPKNFAAMIKLLFDEDALAEESILEWADEGRSEYTLDEVDEETRAAIRGEAEPVIVWLQESDDEESDSEEED
mmetsp:Transcript_3584/g.7445  ORF Transcript_3584/g.7445 Transcript_3584/m.7445 type:complete len:407 (-) Transcript_3584:110-1330(-)|eukprot:CAMPEP_0168758542 /NCGR_PEP_ID=MMETSP0724-20121128/21755_1 /TAXON_ID=265536 /ORGANISM="Amphiprora sp., Strain CCMP467" /LENGTH=406 /DNA_ID=CAMNT_0008807425 /DNA_START=423 /DNA_END=1643 /DNA_ORIENTATION=-